MLVKKGGNKRAERMLERFKHQSSGNNQLNAEKRSPGLLINAPATSHKNATSKQHADI